MVYSREIFISLIISLIALSLFTGLRVFAEVSAPRDQEIIVKEIEGLMRDLEYLYSRGVNISDIIDLLNRAIQYTDRNISEAQRLISIAKEEISERRSYAENTYLMNLVIKYLEITAIASIPLLVYLFLPRIYLYLWYRSHRKWIIKR